MTKYTKKFIQDNCPHCEPDSFALKSPLKETKNFRAVCDVHPITAGHLLIIPKKHMSGICDMDEDDSALMGRLLYVAKVIAEQKNVKEGSYRLVVNNGTLSGQAVFHIHLHLLAGRAMQWPPG